MNESCGVKLNNSFDCPYKPKSNGYLVPFEMGCELLKGKPLA
jgi:hypothetical protein